MCPTQTTAPDRENARLVTPIVALIVVLSKRRNGRRTAQAFGARERRSVRRRNRLTRYAPVRGSSVLPIAYSRGGRERSIVGRAEEKRAEKHAGPCARPSTRRAASAIPAGGQTAVALR